MIYKDKDYIYDSETGGMVHARDKGNSRVLASKYSPCGVRATYKGKYQYVHSGKKQMRVQDYIWRLVYGVIPDGKEVYYIGERHDNRLCNLGIRDIETSKTYKAGRSGKVWRVARTGWAAAKVKEGGKREFIGYFRTKSEALEASNG